MQGLLATVGEFSAYHKLTPREVQVIGLICEGMKNTAIAERLAVSHATVRLHIRNVHRKTKTSDKTELVLRLWKWSMNERESRSTRRRRDSAQFTAV